MNWTANFFSATLIPLGRARGRLTRDDWHTTCEPEVLRGDIRNQQVLRELPSLCTSAHTRRASQAGVHRASQAGVHRATLEVVPRACEWRGHDCVAWGRRGLQPVLCRGLHRTTGSRPAMVSTRLLDVRVVPQIQQRERERKRERRVQLSYMCLYIYIYIHIYAVNIYIYIYIYIYI